MRYHPKVHAGKLPDAILYPTEELEHVNARWEEDLKRHWGVTPEEIEIYKRVRSREQFLEHCRQFSLQFQTELL